MARRSGAVARVSAFHIETNVGLSGVKAMLKGEKAGCAFNRMFQYEKYQGSSFSD